MYHTRSRSVLSDVPVPFNVLRMRVQTHYTEGVSWLTPSFIQGVYLMCIWKCLFEVRKVAKPSRTTIAQNTLNNRVIQWGRHFLIGTKALSLRRKYRRSLNVAYTL